MQILTFSLNNEEYAVDTGIVDTVENMRQVTVVPKSKKYIKGLVNYRGEALPVIDIKRLFNLETELYKTDEKLIIIKYKEQKMALAVTDVNEVINIEESQDEVALNLKMYVININENVLTYLSEEILDKI
ncbi:purine-binding chemotaxis protein CheW [Clostridium punense]|uniref:Purine-binding chemotaxis protein CheW n=1 Tax=Clostridium punense TaxID=1054297 RepID=A0ABS4K2S5_9CLOT|nr:MULTISPECIES: chemotaxis protein CheW [Clostridium]EQB87619.1 hypothetical protein M918_07965 [Clostridium sp. BL8]MBP2022088.1 purine-binding chemotaxis protein CheW [Clostridium punense]